MIIIYIVILPWVFTSIFEDYHRYFDRTARENFISFVFHFKFTYFLQWSSDRGECSYIGDILFCLLDTIMCDIATVYIVWVVASINTSVII